MSRCGTSSTRTLRSSALSLLRKTDGSAVLEFAIALPLLVVFVVGIYDFSGAFNEKQKIEQAAQEGAIVAAAQPTTDIATGNANPVSLQPVVYAVFKSLTDSGVIASGACNPPGTVSGPTSGLTWSYLISGCPDSLTITINRGWVATGTTGNSPVAVGSIVTISYPYHWRFNSVIQLLMPGSSTYQATTTLTESATVHNQM